MKFIADLHIHSKYSRATARNLDLEHLYIAAQLKGITVVGTGDVTHPEWFSEIMEKLEPSEPGLYRLKKDIAEECDKQVPESCRGPVRFVLVSEISNIYKKNGKTRKNHNLVFFPDVEKAALFNAKLDQIGNIKSDGRPILGLDARNLLEILLETSEQAFLVPAHIWTPWFSLLGSKSGFDSMKECFEDLSSYIFAAETGLSSDPPMNRRVSSLDRVTLISNSDAHSPAKLGREANLFDTDLDYFAMRTALETGDPERFLGTIEFYPEEGKYHLDGHRKCDVRLWPKESRVHKGMCPVCGKPLTLGVMYRVEELADREAENIPFGGHPYHYIIPLPEVLSELLRVGPQSKKVQNQYHAVLNQLGPELKILHSLDPDRIDMAGVPDLGEAVRKMRAGEIELIPGYDGEFGKIRITTDREKKRKTQRQRELFVVPGAGNSSGSKKKKQSNRVLKSRKKKDLPGLSKPPVPKMNQTAELNPEQKKAVESTGVPLLIVAGPGTGKTLTLTHRIVHLIDNRNISPKTILAVTFTNKAAQEMRERLARLLTTTDQMPFVATFHALCFILLKEQSDGVHTIIDEEDQGYFIREAIRAINQKKVRFSGGAKKAIQLIAAAKQRILQPSDDLSEIGENSDCDPAVLQLLYAEYQKLLVQQKGLDFEDLILRTVCLLESDPDICKHYRDRFSHILIDEYQDLNHGQYRIVKALAPAGKELFAIGDPDQSIYGFRGSNVAYFKQFVEDYPNARIIQLARNYRSTETILQASYQVIQSQHADSQDNRLYSEIDGVRTIRVMNMPTDMAEAVAIGKTIEQMVGGIGFHSIDFQKVDSAMENREMSFSDFAVLYRTHRQGSLFEKAFQKAGIPHQVVSRDHLFLQPGICEILSVLKLISGVGTWSDLQQVFSVFGTGIRSRSFSVFRDWSLNHQLDLEQALQRVAQFPVQGLSTDQQRKLAELVRLLMRYRRETENWNLMDQLKYIRDAYFKRKEGINHAPKILEAFSQVIKQADLQRNHRDDFFQIISLGMDTDVYDKVGEKVSLMTIHASKGLEFPVVFISGCEDGLLPYQVVGSDSTDIEEEKRLFYVAMTRAKENLLMTYAATRNIFGKKTTRAISPFVHEIEETLRNHEESKRKNNRSKKPLKQIQLELFPS